MRVLLISANALNTPYPVYPLGLDYVAAALVPKHEVKIADVNLIDLHAMDRLIRRFRPEAVGISLRNIDNTDATAPRGFMEAYRQLVKVVRQAIDAPIILGGAGFSIFPEKILAALQADFGIVGEGERLADLLEALESDRAVESLPGVVTPRQGLKVCKPIAEKPQRLFNPEYEHLPLYLARGGMLNIQTKRGCPFKCVYCTYPRIEGRQLRLVAPESAARTAKQLQAAGARYFFITDSVFNAHVEHSLAVARQFKKERVSIPWGAFLAPTEMPEGYYGSLAEAGLSHVEFGTESLSDTVLKAYNKPFRRAHILDAHQKAVQAGLYAAHYFLLGGPGETADTLTSTLSHIDKLKKSVLFLFCGMRIYPHTGLFERAVAEGQISEGQDLLEPVFYQSPGIGRQDIMERVKNAARGRISWVVGSGGDETARLLQRMYSKGYTGPLWNYLIR